VQLPQVLSNKPYRGTFERKRNRGKKGTKNIWSRRRNLQKKRGQKGSPIGMGEETSRIHWKGGAKKLCFQARFPKETGRVVKKTKAMVEGKRTYVFTEWGPKLKKKRADPAGGIYDTVTNR